MNKFFMVAKKGQTSKVGELRAASLLSQWHWVTSKMMAWQPPAPVPTDRHCEAQSFKSEAVTLKMKPNCNYGQKGKM